MWPWANHWLSETCCFFNSSSRGEWTRPCPVLQLGISVTERIATSPLFFLRVASWPWMLCPVILQHGDWLGSFTMCGSFGQMLLLLLCYWKKREEETIHWCPCFISSPLIVQKWVSPPPYRMFRLILWPLEFSCPSYLRGWLTGPPWKNAQASDLWTTALR